MATVRLADEQDEMQIYVLCELLHGENGQHPLDWDRIVPAIRLATRRERGIIGCIGDHSYLKAAVFLLLDPVWYSQDDQLLEIFNFVRKEERRSSYANDLISFSVEMSEKLGIDLQMGILSNIRTEAKVRLYRRRLPYSGAFFTYVPKSKRAAQPAVAAE